MKTQFFDSECFENYYLLAFREKDTGRVRTWEIVGEKKSFDEVTLRQIRNFIAANTLVTFNGIRYDMPLLTLALSGATARSIRKASDRIIKTDLKPWQFYKEYGVATLPVNHIDLIEVAPGVASLKAYGGRLHCQTIQDSPVDFEKPLPDEEIDAVRSYCVNDLLTTEALHDHLTPQLELREQMGGFYEMDLRSKSDAQIAEAILRHEIERRTGQAPKYREVEEGREFKYDVPHWISYNTPEMRSMLEVVKSATFVVNNKGYVEMPPELAGFVLEFDHAKYRMGVGGLHSSEGTRRLESGSQWSIVDRDVASYYPNIILECQLYPSHIGPVFLEIYREIVKTRLQAKAAGDKVTDKTLKIVLNGTFGKLGDRYSRIYDPKLLIQVTLTGQLALLMLIEDIVSNQVATVASANTDGITCIVPTPYREKFNRVLSAWEMNCGFVTEEVEYRSLFSRDVNNYLAVKMDGSWKGKGVYAEPSIAKTPSAEICTDAVVAYLTKGTRIEDTLSACDDLRKFVVVRAVKGGGMYGDQFLGKAVRWYYSTEAMGRAITYKSNGNQVAGSMHSKPVMTLPDEFPEDIHWEWYRTKCIEMLEEVGVDYA